MVSDGKTAESERLDMHAYFSAVFNDHFYTEAANKEIGFCGHRMFCGKAVESAVSHEY
jgi:hypothetical protein